MAKILINTMGEHVAVAVDLNNMKQGEIVMYLEELEQIKTELKKRLEKHYSPSSNYL